MPRTARRDSPAHRTEPFRDYKGLLALAEEIPLERKLVVCHEPRPRRDDHGVEILPVQRFLGALWDGALIG